MHWVLLWLVKEKIFEKIRLVDRLVKTRCLLSLRHDTSGTHEFTRLL